MYQTAWYIFSGIALFLVAIRLLATKKEGWRNQPTLTFTVGIILMVAGALAKQPTIAASIDDLAPNAAWLAADILFLAGLCIATVWIDLMKPPPQENPGWSVLMKTRVGVLMIVATWMVIAAWLESPIWGRLQQGSTNVEGSAILASARLGYFALNIWLLIYLRQGANYHRQIIRNRALYLRLAVVVIALSLAPIAPGLQAGGLLYSFWLGQEVTPHLWTMYTAIQLVVYLMMVVVFFKPIHLAMAWIDKRILVYRLRKKGAAASIQGLNLVSQVDVALARIINAISVSRFIDDYTDTPVGEDVHTRAHWYANEV
ncbi:MAG: hypothetical protein GY869_00900 [Planctomycetes bacterium]|nr:hypothetical protein [Planctomycetota bacterium]